MTELVILVLAAGASQRMRGADKLLLCHSGLPHLRHIALQAVATGRRVLVTIPQDNPLRRAALAGLGVSILPLHAHGEGMSASIRAGLEMAQDASGLMILPADMPEITQDDLNRMITAHKADQNAILRGASGDSLGHPVVFPAALLPQLKTMAGDVGAREIIQKHQGLVKPVPLPARHATLDLDTPEDWADWYADRAAQALMQGEHPSLLDPLQAALLRPNEAVLAVVTRVSGASYRSAGAMMCLFADGTSAGGLTNGCIEGDLATHARTALRDGQVHCLRYGAGSPFFDIRLPCGGGIEVTLYPRPDPNILAQIAKLRSGRAVFSICFSQNGRLALDGPCATGWKGDAFWVDLSPAVQLHIYGEGPEAVFFARLAQGAGIAHHLVTPSEATFAATMQSGCTASFVPYATGTAPDLQADSRTAIVTFFHDHDRELPILQRALQSPAFYIGAQGSRRVAAQRSQSLRDMGVTQTDLDRLHGPIGSQTASRHPQTLAATVLAEILEKSERGTAQSAHPNPQF